MPDVVRSDGSLDEFLNALVAQSAPPPKPTATQTVLDIRRALTGGQTPVPKPVLVPGYADGTSDVDQPSMTGDAVLPAHVLPTLLSALTPGPRLTAAAKNAAAGVAAGWDAIQGGNVAQGIGQAGASAVGGILGGVVGGLGDAYAAPAGVVSNLAAGAAKALPTSMASQITASTGKPVSTVDTGEHAADHSVDDFIAANSHLTNNQIAQIISSTPKVQTPAQQLIGKLTNIHQKTFEQDMAEANKQKGDAKEKAQRAAQDRLLQGLTAISNSQLGVIKYGAGGTE